MALVARDEALQRLQEGNDLLRDLTGSLSDEEWTRSGTMGGGDWSVKDLIGHVASWEEIALESLAQWRAGRKPGIEESVFDTPGAIDRLNAENLERKRPLEPRTIREQADETHSRLLDEIRQMTDEEWGARASYDTERRKRLGDLLGSILGAPRQPFGHAFAHLPDLEGYVSSSRGMAP